MRSGKLFRDFKSTVLLTLALSLCWLPGAVLADTAIRFGGRPAELTLSEVSERTLRIELAQLDEQGRPQRPEPSTILVPFPAVEKLRVRQVADAREIRVGGLRVAVRAEPLTVTVRRPDGKLVQELIYPDIIKVAAPDRTDM